MATKAVAVSGTAVVARVLLVDDDRELRFGVAAALRAARFEVVEAGSCEEATRAFSASAPDVALIDLRLPDGGALELMPRLRAVDESIPVFIMTGYGTIDLAVLAVKQGAEDFLTKPLDTRRVVDLLGRVVERRGANRSGKRPKVSMPFEPRADAMRRLEDEIARLRDADCSVLLLGETGTGKSVTARRIHAVGARSRAPFVDVNCAGLSREFVESELFGHERGAFTGALAAKAGLLDAANGGTLFLDEIGDIDLQVQPKILKVVEERRFRRMGDVKERSVDVRLLAATHHDLLAATAAKLFRADLFYRISTVSLTIPALRDRAEDIVPLSKHLMAGLGSPNVELSGDAERALREHAWPGNIRELKNVLERALLLRSGDVIRLQDLRFDGSSAPSSGRLRFHVPEEPPATAHTLHDMEREHIRRALVAENGRVERAAQRLGVPRSTLYQKLKTYGIAVASMRTRLGRRSDGEQDP